MTVAAARALLFTAGFALSVHLSLLTPSEFTEAMLDWGSEANWRKFILIGLPLILVLAVQVVAAISSTERIGLAPLWVLLGVVVASILDVAITQLFYRPVRGFGLFMVAPAIFIGLPFYLVLLLAASIGCSVRSMVRFTRR